MISFKNNTADPQNNPIKEWKVMFLTPTGLVITLEQAINICKELGFEDYELAIRPVAVAVTDSSYEISTR